MALNNSLILTLIPIISETFIAESVGCNIKNLLKKNIYIKYLITYCLVYFGASITSDKPQHPIELFKLTTFTCFCLLLLGKIKYFYAAIIALCCTIYYISKNLEDYYKENKKKFKHDKKIKILKDYLVKFSLFILIGGTIHSLISKKLKFKDEFNFVSFLFKAQHCEITKEVVKQEKLNDELEGFF